jgi:hypothetical protein
VTTRRARAADTSGELAPASVVIVYTGRCRIVVTGQLLCVAPPDGSQANAYVLVEFEAGEEHGFDCVQWVNKNNSIGTGFVVRTGDGDAHLMPHLFERVAVVLEEQQKKLAPQVRTSTSRPVRIVNVKGINKPDDRARVVYVGRKFAGWPEHELHNPFKPRPGEPVGTCLAKYKAAVLARLTLEEDLAALWAETGQGRRPIGCWCVDATAGDGSEVVCHGQILAEMLRERFAA